MTQGGLSRVVARLLRPFQRKERRERQDAAAGNKYDANLAANSKLVLSSAACNDVELPSAFFRLLRSILQQTPATIEMINTDVAPLRYSNFSASTGSLLKRADPVTSKTLERMLTLLGDDEGRHSDDSAALSNSRISFADGRPTLYGKRSTRSVPLRAAAEQLLQLWECVIQILSAGREATTRNTMSQPHGGHHLAVSLEEQSQLEYSALSLMLLLAQRQEFDSLFLVLAHGGCKTHHQATQPRRRSSVEAGSFRGDRANSVVVALPPSRQSFAVHPSRKSSRRSGKKKDKQAEAERPLCDIARKYLGLHQQTLLFAYAATHGSSSPTAAHAKILLAKPKSCEVARTLFSTMVALSYARVPYMREQMLESLQNTLQHSVVNNDDRKACFSSSNPQQERVRSKSRYEEMSMTMFQWNQYISVKCDQCIGPFSNSDGWIQPAHLVNQLLSDNEGRILLIAHLIQHLSPQLAMGQIEWRAVPGFPIILQVILASTRTIYEAQLVEMEPKWQESDVEERATTGKGEDSIRDSFSIASESGRGSDSSINKSGVSFFFAQVMAMLHDNPQFIRDFLLNVLGRTNYLLPHHVELCLQYLGKLITEFPSYFVNEPQAHRIIGSTGSPFACADTELLSYVFTCLMESEHFAILKHTELFLLKHFAHLSITLQSQLTTLFAAQFRRLFLHWNRDVRYCYYHILLYLTYPGNRLVLCAKSDESIMGAEAAQLFEIPGLVRTSSGANWDVFDTPLYQVLMRYNHVTRARRRGVASKPLPPTWADEVPFTVIERTIKEYKTHVHTYFAYARQLSLHERVPTPAFEVKSTSSTAGSSKGKLAPAPLPSMKLSR